MTVSTSTATHVVVTVDGKNVNVPTGEVTQLIQDLLAGRKASYAQARQVRTVATAAKKAESAKKAAARKTAAAAKKQARLAKLEAQIAALKAAAKQAKAA